MRRLTPIALLLSLAVAACGDDEGDPPQPDTGTATATVSATTPDHSDAALPADPCRLLSRREVEAELGKGATSEANEGKTRDRQRYSECTWTVRRNGLGAGALTVAVIASPQRYEDRAREDGAEPVQGLGDGAVAFTGRAGVTVVDPGELRSGAADTERLVFVRAGDRTLVVEVNLIAVRDRDELIERLPNARLARIARAALGRLELVADEGDGHAGVDAIVACLEKAGLRGVSADEDSPFDEVELEIVATDAQGDASLLAYVYDTPAEARAGRRTIQLDPAFYPARAVAGRVLSLYGKRFPKDLEPEVSACLRSA